MSGLDQDESREPFYARDVDGLLVRYDPTRGDYKVRYSVFVDGEPVEILRAVRARDGRGNLKLDGRGRTVPRYSTILDAALRASRLRHRRRMAGEPVPVEGEPIPTLCHRDHLSPVGVCRVCSVLVAAGKEGAPADARLVPACCTEIRAIFEAATGKDGIAPVVRIYTHNATDRVKVRELDEAVVAGDYVRSGIAPLLRMLGAHHLHPDLPRAVLRRDHPRADPRKPDLPGTDLYFNELRSLSGWPGLGVAGRAGRRRPPRMFPRTQVVKNVREGGMIDDSSNAIVVDHNNCILCNRCIRGCSDVRGFRIIGLDGKGSSTRIGFDLGRPMGQSDCVSCGECMISCPTGALTFAQHVHKSRPKTTVPADQVVLHKLFKGLPLNYLKWTEGAVVDKPCVKGVPLCEEGDYGSTAFILLKGRFDIRLRPLDGAAAGPGVDDLTARFGGVVNTRTRHDLIVGEMSLMNNDRRSSTVVPMSEDCRVWEISRDVLSMLLRDSQARGLLDRLYCRRALRNVWRHCRESPREAALRTPAGALHRWILAHLTEKQRDDCIRFLGGRMRILRVGPGQSILDEKYKVPDRPSADDPQDGWFIIRSGFVEVTRSAEGRPADTLDLLTPGDHFGEIALLSLRSEAIAARLPGGPASRGVRTGTCRARDHVELVHVPGDAFLDLLASFPAILEVMERNALALMSQNVGTLRARDSRFQEFVRQGLYQGQNLLVLDLDKCTRCQDCVKGCADSHDGQTRLILEGERFDRFLVPRACRSCHDPLCLKECPVDAIHREPKHGSLAVVIDENRCIGCGLCALNCPYGSIYLEPSPRLPKARLAYNCDLCESCGGDPHCVRACPHEAASRATGFEFARSLGLYPLGSIRTPEA